MTRDLGEAQQRADEPRAHQGERAERREQCENRRRPPDVQRAEDEGERLHDAAAQTDPVGRYGDRDRERREDAEPRDSDEREQHRLRIVALRIADCKRVIARDLDPGEREQQ